MATARTDHTATQLVDGRVLIAGGRDEATALESAEVFDPRTGTFSPTGSMSGPRMSHTATSLADGRVVIVGGDPWQMDTYPLVLASAEIYDPTTGKFSPTGPMASTRVWHSATSLPDGRVLVAGGAPAQDEGGALATAEVYDPATGRFSPTGSMTSPRAGSAAILLLDGRVLIVGGTDYVAEMGDDLATAEVYNPVTGTFSVTGPMADSHPNLTATLLADGRVLILGGTGGIDPWGEVEIDHASAETFDPMTGTFTVTGPMDTGRELHAATLLPDGRVLVTGGFGGDGFVASVETYDPGTGTFVVAEAMTVARARHTSTALPDGSVLLAGGCVDLDLLASEIYIP